MGKEENSRVLPNVGEDFEFYEYVSREYQTPGMCCSCGRPITDTTAYSTPEIIIFKKKGVKDNYQVQWSTSYKACFDCFENIPVQAKEVLSKNMKRYTYLRDQNTAYKNRLVGNIEHREALPLYQHYTSEREKFPFAMLVDTCAICKNPLKEGNVVDMQAYYVMIPVKLDVELTGGKLRICRRCNYKRIEDLIYKETTRNLKSRCARCQEEYLITIDEKKYRDSTSIHGEYLCPACTVAELEFPQKLEGPISVYMGPPERYSYFTCGCCSKTVALDRTLSADYISRKMVLSAAGDLKLRCETCTALQVTKEETLVDLDDNVYAILYKHPEESNSIYGNIFLLKQKESLEIGAIEPSAAEAIVQEMFKIKNSYLNEHKY